MFKVTKGKVQMVGEFMTYEEAVAFCKQELDKIREYANEFNEGPGAMHEMSDDDAFENRGGDLRIEPEPEGEHFSAYRYFTGRDLDSYEAK